MPAIPGHRTAFGLGHVERRNQLLDSGLDLVSHTADEVEALSGRIGEWPILMASAGVVGADISTTHRNHHVALTNDVVGPELWKLGRNVDTHFSHCLDRGRVRLRRRI